MHDDGDCAGHPEWRHVIEWSADCNNDGIVDYGQCRDGSLPDYNGDNIPDCCEQGTTCVVGSYPVQWREEEGGNGHWYRFGESTIGENWTAAAARCAASGGHLVTPVSAAEDDFVLSRLVAGRVAPASFGPYIGGFKEASLPDRGTACPGWHWVTGEPFSYLQYSNACSVWAQFYDYEDRLHYWIGSQLVWNNTVASTVVHYQLTEWSADCNNDGIVDYGQILTGQLADSNANGVPDSCESVLHVPSEFATIQAAIDAVPTGAVRTVLVAAGAYNESFSLNGKNVVVRGAPKNATILDGTGLATSIARFTGGEPATAGLENLVFRNGTTGSRIVPKATFTVGGAVYGRDSSAFIRNCRFEQNEADFGGAVYLLRCDSAVEGCVFAGNEALTDGGAFFAYECAGSVRTSDFTANSCGASGSGNGGAFKTVGARTVGGTFLLQDCTITGTISGVDGAAVHHFENGALGTAGALRIVDTEISGNTTIVGAGGVRHDGRQSSLVLAGATVVCPNTVRNIDGPFLLEGGATVCDCLTDMTGDGSVNGGDLGVVLNAWGLADAQGTGDVNHDGVVDGADLALVLGSWGPCGG
jgi:hypothetical protein